MQFIVRAIHIPHDRAAAGMQAVYCYKCLFSDIKFYDIVISLVSNLFLCAPQLTTLWHVRHPTTLERYGNLLKINHTYNTRKMYSLSF